MLTWFAIALECAQQKHHHHHGDDDIPILPNPHSQVGPQQRFERLLMMLEAQFGSNIGPIERPRVATELAIGTQQNGTADGTTEDVNAERIADIESAELSRLHALGIPVPGIEIQVDKQFVRVWLENLEVECANAVLRDRVRVVVERAVETVAGLWAETPMTREAPAPNGFPKQQMEEAAEEKAAAIEAQG